MTAVNQVVITSEQTVCSNSCTDDTLNVRIEDILQLQLTEQPERGRFNVTVIGLHQGNRLIVSAPRSNGNYLLLHQGQQFVVRSLAGKQIVGFTAEVVKPCNTPYPYLHLKPVGELEQCNVRNAFRIDVNLIASLRKIQANDGALIKASVSCTGTVLNLSTTGCLLKTTQAIDDDTEVLSVSVKVGVVGQNRTLKLASDVCSRRQVSDDTDTPYYLYGTQFRDIDDDKNLILHCFVNEHIVNAFYKIS